MSGHGFLLKDNIKRVNIVGSAPGYKDAPEDNGYIWGVNNVHLLREVDLIIDVHANRMSPKEFKDKYHMSVVDVKQIPMYAIDKIDGRPNIERYPIEHIMEEFDTDYFGCGIDYMIALAVYLGAEEIHIYGVWLSMESEYARQKPSVEFWIGIAKGRGVKVEVHGDRSNVLRTHNGRLYGYGKPQQWIKKYNPEQYELIDKYGGEMNEGADSK
jgi:hypothetical protein